jgi:hypothetical protein
MNPWLSVGVVALATALLAGCSCCGAGERGGAPPPQALRHVVLFKFKDDAPPDQIRSIEAKFRALKSQIPQILDFEWGTNISPENRAQGFTHCFLVTFRDAAGRDAYLPHPAHKEFGAALGPVLDKVLVVDYLARD